MGGVYTNTDQCFNLIKIRIVKPLDLCLYVCVFVGVVVEGGTHTDGFVEFTGVNLPG